jgi:tetratricopeptide (TPR) repeat protein
MPAVAKGDVPLPPKDSHVPGWLRQIVLRGLSVKPSERFPSMEALLTALARSPGTTRMRWLLAGATIAVVASLGIGYRVAMRERPSCRGAESKLAGIWDASRRAAVHAAFLASGKSYAEPTFRSTSATLDAWSRAWANMHTEACEATLVRSEQSHELLDLRMQCLEHRREELQALTELFSHASGQLVEHATEAALGLSSVEGCSRAASLRAPRPPVDPNVRARVEAVRKQLAQAKARRDSGQYGEALRLAAPAADEAKRLKYRPLEAETLEELGNSQEHHDDYALAETSLRDATLAAEAGRHPRVIADAAIQLVWVVGYNQARPKEGHEWARRAEAALEALGGDAELQAYLSSALGALADRDGNCQEALKHDQRALDLRRQASGSESSPTVNLMTNVGISLRCLGRYDDAIAMYRRAIALGEKTLGPEHPIVAWALDSLGAALSPQGKYEEALALHERALAIESAALGAGHPDLATELANVGSVLVSLNRYDQALERLNQALAIYEKTVGPDHPDLAEALTSVGRAYLGKRLPQKAVAPLERAMSLREHSHGNPLNVGETQFTLARALWELGPDPKRRARARTLAGQARTAYAAAAPEANKDLATIDGWLKEHAN